jgi:hypothetical protein
MLLYSTIFFLQLASAAFGATLARSGSQLTSYALGDCTNELASVQDIANDGVQGTPCQTFKVLHRTDNTVYRNLAQSVKTVNIQKGCTADAYSGPNCAGSQQILKVAGPTNGEQCHKLDIYAESVKITCT